MTIKDFATKYNLRVTTDKQDDTPVITGGIGHIYEYSASELGVMILPSTYKPRLYHAIEKKCLSVGMTLQQGCDAEGALSFDPECKTQARMAIKAAQVRPKKKISEGHKAKLLAGLQTFKNSGSGAILEGGLTC